MGPMTLSDADALLNASASPSSNAGPVMAATLVETSPVSPVPGGAIVPVTTQNPQVNMATVDIAPPADDFDPKVLLWVGAGIGTAWLLSRSDRTVSGPKKQNWVVPAVILAAGAAWYFFGDKITAATSTVTDTTGQPTETDTARQALLNTYNGQPQQMAVINTADADTIRKWALIVSVWNGGPGSNNPYVVGLNGAPTTDAGSSIGKWWEGFSAANHFG